MSDHPPALVGTFHYVKGNHLRKLRHVIENISNIQIMTKEGFQSAVLSIVPQYHFFFFSFKIKGNSPFLTSILPDSATSL